jgi:hypothetical protein
MNRNSMPPDDSWESDAVWQLLDQALPKLADARFTADTVRAARLTSIAKPWWHHLLSPLPLAGLAATTAALAFAIISLVGPAKVSEVQLANQAFAIQDVAETETLIAAADQLDDFSDTELVGLIGF